MSPKTTSIRQSVHSTTSGRGREKPLQRLQRLQPLHRNTQQDPRDWFVSVSCARCSTTAKVPSTNSTDALGSAYVHTTEWCDVECLGCCQQTSVEGNRWPLHARGGTQIKKIQPTRLLAGGKMRGNHATQIYTRTEPSPQDRRRYY